MKNLLTVIFTSGLLFILNGQSDYINHWKINDDLESISWDVSRNWNLPYSDNVEMAGLNVACIVHYSVDTSKFTKVEREVYFPQLHPFIKTSDPWWQNYRAYFKQTITDDILPKVYLADKEWVLAPAKYLKLDGKLIIEHEVAAGINLKRQFYPSMSRAEFYEHWKLANTTDTVISIKVLNQNSNYNALGEKGEFEMLVSSNAEKIYNIAPGASANFDIVIKASIKNSGKVSDIAQNSIEERNEFLKQISSSLILETPDSTINTLFHLSKIRGSESIFESELGLIHSPGGGRYYVGIWANDQAEYISPFFPYLGYDNGNISAVNTFKAFKGARNADYSNIRYAFEIEGLVKPFDLDRGDAAMIAYGALQFLMANGDKNEVDNLWPLVQWCLEYCRRQLNDEGVVNSESDEMEGRIETGTANLSTSSLYYGALDLASHLLNDIDPQDPKVLTYRLQAEELAHNIDSYFGANIEGLNTYKYFKEHKNLRHWICLPLVVGIHNRKHETIRALFENLWTPDGVAVEKKNPDPNISKIFWDRGTLYALRGTFLAGATDISLEKLKAFSQQRLLGHRVPYVVEAYPEGSMAHLSAESGLYCRVITEGLFGIKPVGLNSFELRPQLPSDWNEMALKNVKAFGGDFDIYVERKGDFYRVMVYDNINSKSVFDNLITLDVPFKVTLD